MHKNKWGGMIVKLLVILPAFNEAQNLPLVIEGLQKTCPQYDYLIINDGSNDNTRSLCEEKGYNILNLPINLGLSGAFQAGLLYAKKHHYDAVIQFDADGQHLPEYIEPLAKKLEEGNDIVIGSRYVTVPKPKNLRTFGSYLISLAMFITTRHLITDPTSGMRIFNDKMIDEFSSNLNYSPEPDTISYLLSKGAKIAEVQVEMQERVFGKSYLTFARSIRYMTEMSISILLIQWFRKRTPSNDFAQSVEDDEENL